MTAGDIWTAESFEVFLISGDGRGTKLVKSFQARQFQATLAAQLDRQKQITMDCHAAALGTRGDKFDIQIPLTAAALATAADTPEINHMELEIFDVKNVDPTVQLSKARGGYAWMSPWESHHKRITSDMQLGIVSEPLTVMNTVTAAEGATEVSQIVGGVTDARFTVAFNEALEAASGTDKIYHLYMAPTQSNVLVLKPHSRPWVLPPVATTGNGFVEKID